MSRRIGGGYQPTDAGPIPEPPRSGSNVTLDKPSKLRKVKTIRTRLDDYELFDETVNFALAEGWYLVKRYTLPSYVESKYNMLVAELQRYDDYDE